MKTQLSSTIFTNELFPFKEEAIFTAVFKITFYDEFL